MGGRGGGAPGNAGRGESPASQATPVEDLSIAQVTQVVRDIQRDFNAGYWVGLATFRERIGGTRQQQDSMMMRLARAGQIRLIPEENQKTITSRDRSASIDVSGEPKHLIGITAG
jgi:hypothetical protein